MAPQIKLSKLRQFGDDQVSRDQKRRLEKRLEAARLNLEHLIRQAERYGLHESITEEDKAYLKMRAKLISNG